MIVPEENLDENLDLEQNLDETHEQISKTCCLQLWL